MQHQLKRRFEYVTNPSTILFDPLFVEGTFLHPGYREILDDKQLSSAKAQLIKRMKKPLQNQALEQLFPDDDLDSPNGFQDGSCSDSHHEEPPTKKFKHVQGLLQEKRKAKEHLSQALKPEEAEVNRYSEQNYDFPLEDDPFGKIIKRTTHCYLKLHSISFPHQHQLLQLSVFFPLEVTQHMEKEID